MLLWLSDLFPFSVILPRLPRCLRRPIYYVLSELRLRQLEDIADNWHKGPPLNLRNEPEPRAHGYWIGGPIVIRHPSEDESETESEPEPETENGIRHRGG